MDILLTLSDQFKHMAALNVSNVWHTVANQWLTFVSLVPGLNPVANPRCCRRRSISLRLGRGRETKWHRHPCPPRCRGILLCSTSLVALLNSSGCIASARMRKPNTYAMWSLEPESQFQFTGAGNNALCNGATTCCTTQAAALVLRARSCSDWSRCSRIISFIAPAND